MSIFLGFEEELKAVSLEKIVTITYSEEMLQKNFTVIINILARLSSGMGSIYSSLS